MKILLLSLLLSIFVNVGICQEVTDTTVTDSGVLFLSTEKPEIYKGYRIWSPKPMRSPHWTVWKDGELVLSGSPERLKKCIDLLEPDTPTEINIVTGQEFFKGYEISSPGDVYEAQWSNWGRLPSGHWMQFHADTKQEVLGFIQGVLFKPLKIIDGSILVE